MSNNGDDKKKTGPRRILGLSSGAKQSTNGEISSRGRDKTVVVIKKGKPNHHEQKKNTLTDEELERRIQALKIAKQETAQKAEAEKLAEQSDSDPIVKTDPNKIIDARVRVREKAATSTARATGTFSVKRDHKIRDLNFAQKAAIPPETNVEAEPTAIAATHEKSKDYKKKEEERTVGHIVQSRRKTAKDKTTKILASTRSKLSAAQIAVLGTPEEEDSFKSSSRRRSRASKQKVHHQQKILREVELQDSISTQDLAHKMSEKLSTVNKLLAKLGITTQLLDVDTAEMIVSELGHKPKRVQDKVSKLLHQAKGSDNRNRPPIVTIMGHVDHGKTSLLDALRSTDVASSEHGGITQHIGAYSIVLDNGQAITFIDTPGHEAFTAMRVRGAKITDIVVLVVAADDGIKAQTIEAISHAKAAQVPIVVAINKIDRPGSNIDNVKNMLVNYDLVADDLGGSTMVVGVSARDKINLDKLEELILLQAELLDLKADYDVAGRGYVIESSIDKKMGAVATLLVKDGHLSIGDIVTAGGAYGKIRVMLNDKGQQIKKASPSMAVQIVGLNDAPAAGDEFIIVEDERQARQVVQKTTKQSATAQLSLQELIQQKGKKDLNIVFKADVQGSAEAIIHSLQKIISDEVNLKILYSSVGTITESDVMLAAASKAVILGFNVKTNTAAAELVKRQKVEFRYYSIIYDMIDDVKRLVSGLMSPVLREKVIGHAQVRKIFEISDLGKIAGSYITDGIVKRACNARVLRAGQVLCSGKVTSLRRQKDNVKEVRDGLECGIGIEKFGEFLEGDIIEAYEVTEESASV